MWGKVCVFAISTIVAVYLYQRISEEKCHIVPAIDNVDYEKLTGIWYTYQLSTPLKKNRKCFMIDLALQKTFAVVKEIWLHNNIRHEMDVNILPGNYSSHLRAQWSIFPSKSLNLVNFDYDDFLVFYLCWPLHKDGGVVFVWTRQKHPDQATIDKAHKSIIEVGLSPTQPFLYTIDHDGCDMENK